MGMGIALPNAIQQVGQATPTATGTGNKGGVGPAVSSIGTTSTGTGGKGGAPTPEMPMVPSPQISNGGTPSAIMQSPMMQQLMQSMNGVAPTATTPMPGQVGKGGAPLGSSPTPMPTPGMGGKGSMPLGPNDGPIGSIPAAGGNKGGIKPQIDNGVGGKGGVPQKPNHPFGMHPGYKGGAPFRPGQPGPMPRPQVMPAAPTSTVGGGLNNLTSQMIAAMR